MSENECASCVTISENVFMTCVARHVGKNMFDTSAISDNNYVTNVMSAIYFRQICHISDEYLTDVLHIRLIENAGNSEIGRRLYSNT